MMINGPWNSRTLDKTAGLDYGVVPDPGPDRRCGTVVSPFGGETWTVPQTGDEAKQTKAAELVQCLNSDENEVTICRRHRHRARPSRQLASQVTAQNPDLEAFASQVPDLRARTGELGDRSGPPPPRRSTRPSRTRSSAGMTPEARSRRRRMAETGRPTTRRTGASAPAGGGRRGGGTGSPAGRSRALVRTRLGCEVAFLVPAVVYLVLFFGYPVVKNVVMGFQEYTTKTFFTGEAPWVGLANYAQRRRQPGLRPGRLLNTLLFTGGSILGQFVLGLAIALFFHRRFPLSGVAALAAAAAVAHAADRRHRGVAVDPGHGQRRAEPVPDAAARASTPIPAG